MDAISKKAMQRINRQELMARLQEQEAIMHANGQAILRWAQAAYTIRAEKLFKAVAKTWEEYCRDRWQRTRQAIEYHIKGLLLGNGEAPKPKPEPVKQDVIESERKKWEARFKMFSTARVVKQEWLDEGRVVIARMLRMWQAFRDSPIAPPTPAKCRHCGVACQWVTTENDKRILLEAEPGGGSWEIMNNVAVKCEWDKEAASARFKNHFLSCKKMPTRGVSNEPLPD